MSIVHFCPVFIPACIGSLRPDPWRDWVKESEIEEYITQPDRPEIGVEMKEEAPAGLRSLGRPGLSRPRVDWEETAR
jgi:L-alanine-DL-glutamate epimerase-like enolase superfamily enzyme